VGKGEGTEKVQGLALNSECSPRTRFLPIQRQFSVGCGRVLFRSLFALFNHQPRRMTPLAIAEMEVYEWLIRRAGPATWQFATELTTTLRMRSVINQLLADHSGQSIETIEKDTDRDFIMSAQQAKEYGLIDEIIQKHR